MEKCVEVLQQYYEGETFLQKTVNGDETWVHHYETASKHKSMEWRHVSPSRAKKLGSMPSIGKVTLMLFWDFNGPILKHYQDQGQIVNNAWYYAMFEEEMKPAIHSKHR